MTSFSFRAQAFARTDTQVSVDGDHLTLVRPNRAPELYPLSDIRAGSLMLADNPGSPGQTWYLKLAMAGRGPLWVNSTSPKAPDGGADGFLAFIGALKAALAAEGRPEVIVAGSRGLAWLGVAFAGFFSLVMLGALGWMVVAVVRGHAADAVAPGLLLIVMSPAVLVGLRQWRSNRGA